MMTVTAQEKDLIFRNMLNGVDKLSIAQAFHKTEEDINEIFKFVVSKIKSYMFINVMPFMSLSSIDEARKNRLQALEILDKLNLDKAPKHAKIIEQPLEEFIKNHV